MKSREISILENAHKILEQFARDAKAAENKPCRKGPLYMGETDPTMTAQIRLADSGLTEKQFFAVSQLIEFVCGEELKSVPNLELQCFSGSDRLTIKASYEPRHQQRHELKLAGYETPLLAPIAKVPFAKMQKSLDKIDAILTSSKNENKEVIEFPFDDMLLLSAIENSCKELDERFHLNRHFSNNIISTSPKAFVKAYSLLLSDPKKEFEHFCAWAKTSSSFNSGENGGFLKLGLFPLVADYLGAAPSSVSEKDLSSKKIAGM